jgi:hypothetical protein
MKEGAAQAMAGEFQEETRKVEATVRIQQQGQMFTGKKTNKNWSAALTVAVSNKILLFCYRSQNQIYVK